MDAQTLRNLSLVFHIVGIVALSSGAVSGVIADQMLWQSVKKSPAQALGLAELSAKFGMAARVGSILMLLSGLGLLAASNWVYWGQFWLMVKLVLYVLLVLNGALVAERAEKELEKLLPQLSAVGEAIPAAVATGGSSTRLAGEAGRSEMGSALEKIRGRLNYFHISENLMFLAVIILGVFKFS